MGALRGGGSRHWASARATNPSLAAVVVVTPDGNLAGMARVTDPGLLQPRLVLDAAG